MNDGRCFYLGMHNIVDVTNHFIKNAHCYYKIWKYWHIRELHGKVFVKIVAWNYYIECVGEIELD